MEDQAQTEMPKYKCHKEVRALKIDAIKRLSVGGDADLLFLDSNVHGHHDPIRVTDKWLAQHSPELGGYYVEYADGYKSYSPAKAFEEGYTPIPTSTVTPDGDRMLQHFTHQQLRPELAAVSKPFCELAHSMVATLPRNAERSAGLRKLLEAKDCAVRTYLEG